MKPEHLVAALRTIASKIDASKSPKRNLIVSDLKKIVASLDTVMSGSDGPVTPFVVLSRAFDQVAAGAATATDAANFIAENPLFKSVDWEGSGNPDFNTADGGDNEESEFLDDQELEEKSGAGDDSYED